MLRVRVKRIIFYKKDTCNHHQFPMFGVEMMSWAYGIGGIGHQISEVYAVWKLEDKIQTVLACTCVSFYLVSDIVMQNAPNLTQKATFSQRHPGGRHFHCWFVCLQAERRLYEDMFGSMRPVPADEYIRIYQLTGIDIDGRRQLFEHMIPHLESSTRRLIAFVKSIPGFHSLPMEDQMVLLKSKWIVVMKIIVRGTKNQSDSRIKACFYVAQYPIRCTTQGALHFIPWQTCSFRHQLAFLGSVLATQQLRAKTIHSHFHRYL